MNKEQVSILRRGAEPWNLWRRESLVKHPDLRKACLEGLPLVGVDLRGVIMDQASLRGANLNGANLVRARLRGADLTNTNLMRANLRAAELQGAIFAGALLYETALINVNLSETKGLEECIHRGPSIIDHRTFRKTTVIPIAFLQGVGLPDTFIDYIPSMVRLPIQYYSCFISYSTRDQQFADLLYKDLQSRGIRCWFAPHDLPIGGKIVDDIDSAIRARDKVIIILSKKSIESDWVEDEVKTAYEEERKRKRVVLFPVRLDDEVMRTNEAWAAKLRVDRNIGDFRKWMNRESYNVSLERAIRDLTLVGISTPSTDS